MDLAALIGLAGLLFVKEMGIPIPVPGDLLVLGAGVAAAGAGAAAAGPALSAPLVLLAILLAGFVGGSLQFLMVRGAFRRPLLAILARFGVPADRIERLADWLRRRGTRGVAVARATPGLRIGAISASGIAALPFPVFLGGLVAGNTIFVGGHFALGYLLGAPALELVKGAGGVAAVIVAAIVLAGFGAVAWAWFRRRTRAGATVQTGLAGAGAWAEASCPACLAVTLVTRTLEPG